MNSNLDSKKSVPSIHPGCSLAETGGNEYDDFDHPLEPMLVVDESSMIEERIPYNDGIDGPYVEVKKRLPDGIQTPADAREETVITIAIKNFHPLFAVKKLIADVTSAWIFLDPQAVKYLEEFQYKFRQNSVSRGKFFRLPNNDTFALQQVKYFEGWECLHEWEIDGKKFERTETPEFIIQVVMK